MYRQKLLAKAFIFICALCAAYLAVSCFLGDSEAAGRKRHKAKPQAPQTIDNRQLKIENRQLATDSECSISGFVLDYKEKTEVANAKLQARLLTGRQKLLTEYSEDDGFYCFSGLKIGKYSVTTKKSGYQNNVKKLEYKDAPLDMNIYLKCKSSGGCADTSGGTSGGGGGSSGGTTGGSTGGGTTGGSTGGTTGSTDATAPSNASIAVHISGSPVTVVGTWLPDYSLKATDNIGVTGYYLSESSSTPSASAPGWTSVASTTSLSKYASYTFNSLAEGIKTVYAWFKDAAGNISYMVSASVTLDATAPVTTASPVGGPYTSAQTVTLACSDAVAGCSSTHYTTDGTTPTFASSRYSAPITISFTTTLKFFSYDGVANQEAVKTATYTISTLATLSADATSSGLLALDSNSVYFAEYYSAGTRIKKVPTNGGSAITLYDINASSISGTEGSSVSRCAVDVSYIYCGVGGYLGHAIFKLPIGGGALTILTRTTGGGFIGVIGSEAYFSHNFSAISKISVNGGATTSVASSGFVRDVAHDSANIYYVHYDSKDVKRVDIATGAITSLITGNTLEGSIPCVDSANLYYINNGGGVKTVPKSGGSVTTLLSSGYGRISDDTYLYFVSTDGSILQRIPVNGGTSTTLTTDYNIGVVKVDTSFIYWTARGTGETGRIMKMAKP